jgi:hypothetical protein
MQNIIAWGNGSSIVVTLPNPAWLRMNCERKRLGDGLPRLIRDRHGHLGVAWHGRRATQRPSRLVEL